MPVYGFDGAEQRESVPRAFGTAWSDELDQWWIWDGTGWVLVYPDPNAAGPLLPVENLAVTAGPDDRSVTVGWTLPTQPTITPTNVIVRVPEISSVWTEYTYPTTSFSHGALDASTAYQVQVKLIERVDGTIVNESAWRSVFFTTTAAPIGVPVPDPGGTGGDSIIPIDGGTGGTETPPSTADGCWWEWKLQYLQINPFQWVDEGTTGTVDGDGTEDINLDLALLSPSIAYRICRRTACDTTSNGVADTFGDWGDCSQSFVGISDWTLDCGGIPDSDFAGLTPVADAVYRFPLVCLNADDQVVLFDEVSSIEIGKGDSYAWSFRLDNDWFVQADADGGNTMSAPLPALETLLVADQDATFLVKYMFDSTHVLSARTYAIAAIGGLGVSFWITETVTGWTPSVKILGENGLIELTGTELPLDTSVHTFALRWDADADKDFWVDGAEVDSDTTGDQYSTFTRLPFYITGAGEYGSNGQQAGWNRTLTDAELIETGKIFDFSSGMFACTGAAAQYTVPAGVTEVRIIAAGAGPSAAGFGQEVAATFSVTPGEILDLRVGCATGGYPNGGAPGGASGGNYQGAWGGGSSDVRREAAAFADVLIVAGAGGSPGYQSGASNPGDGGYPNGTDGSNGSSGGPGLGGTQVAGGLAGTYATAGVDGSAGQGGQAGAGSGALGDSGGSGGGGWFGGGGGGGNGSFLGTGNGAGGGGSSHVAAEGTRVVYQIAAVVGNGYIHIGV